MKNYFLAIGLALVVSLLLISCNKSTFNSREDLNSDLNYSTKLDTTDVYNQLINNKAELQANLNIIAKGFVGMLNDTVFSDKVVTEAKKRNVNNEYAVTISTLMDVYDDLHLDLMEIILDSADQYGPTAGFLDSLESIIEAFTIDDITFIPKLFIPTLDTVHFNHGSWNARDVSYTAVAQFYIPDDNPTYKYIDGFTKTDRKTDSIFVRPAWYISVSLDINQSQFNSSIVGLICTPGEHNCVCRESQTGQRDWCDWDDYPGGIGDCSNIIRPDGECEDVCMYTVTWNVID